MCVCVCEGGNIEGFAYDSELRLCVHKPGDKFQFTSNENPIVYTSALIVINSRWLVGAERHTEYICV